MSFRLSSINTGTGNATSSICGIEIKKKHRISRTHMSDMKIEPRLNWNFGAELRCGAKQGVWLSTSIRSLLKALDRLDQRCRLALPFFDPWLGLGRIHATSLRGKHLVSSDRQVLHEGTELLEGLHDVAATAQNAALQLTHAGGLAQDRLHNGFLGRERCSQVPQIWDEVTVDERTDNHLACFFDYCLKLGKVFPVWAFESLERGGGQEHVLIIHKLPMFFRELVLVSSQVNPRAAKFSLFQPGMGKNKFWEQIWNCLFQQQIQNWLPICQHKTWWQSRAVCYKKHEW